MKYMILIYNEAAREPAYGTPAFDAMMAGYMAANAKMRADGVMRGGEALQGIQTATSVRVRDGRTETMDGPFAETKEYLGGFYLIEVPDLDAAIGYAAMLPSATWGTIEIRPMMDYNPEGN
jgi:hypothetical protein